MEKHTDRKTDTKTAKPTPGAFPAIRAALDKPPVQYKSCTHWPNCETASAGLPCYHFDHACTIKRDTELHAAAAAELEAARGLAEALRMLADAVDAEVENATPGGLIETARHEARAALATAEKAGE